MHAAFADQFPCRPQADGAVVRCGVIGGQELGEFLLCLQQGGVDTADFRPGHHFLLGAEDVEGGEVLGREGPEDEARCDYCFANGVAWENGEGGADEEGAGGRWFCGLLVGHCVCM